MFLNSSRWLVLGSPTTQQSRVWIIMEADGPFLFSFLRRCFLHLLVLTSTKMKGCNQHIWSPGEFPVVQKVSGRAEVLHWSGLPDSSWDLIPFSVWICLGIHTPCAQCIFTSFRGKWVHFSSPVLEYFYFIFGLQGKNICTTHITSVLIDCCSVYSYIT